MRQWTIEFFFRFGKVANADLVIESVPEDPSIKKRFYKKASSCSPEKPFSLVIFYNAPSQFAESTGRPAQLQRYILPTRYGNIQLKLWDIPGRMRTYLTPLLRFNLSEW
jgi:hypothetical protein